MGILIAETIDGVIYRSLKKVSVTSEKIGKDTPNNSRVKFKLNLRAIYSTLSANFNTTN